MVDKNNPSILSKTSNSDFNRYLNDNNISHLRDHIINKIEENGLTGINLASIGKVDITVASLIKELVNTNQIDENELADQVAREIIGDIEIYVSQHLRKYRKYSLNAPTIASNISESTAQFFNLISLLKDVSLLGKKLLELAPQLNAQRSPSKAASSSSSSNEDKTSQSKSISNDSDSRDEDATSEDLLAALIESSSSDDFLILTSSLDSISTEDMMIVALIYIKIHECFTLSHDIQNVAMVLRRTKFMISNILAPKNQMELITKLLTSIGRYNEMNYVFDLFRDRNQFEILLSKGVEKTPELRIALFNYVKKNPEFYPLVTLNFSMFREIAESLEASAIKRLNRVILTSKRKKTGRQETSKESSEPSSSIKQLVHSRESLNLSLIELVDASDCFAKAGCYKRSNYCGRKAKLIALQLALLPSEINVLDLQESELNDLIVGFGSFREAYIISEAYDYHLSWRQALFKNVILIGNLAYLHEYCRKYDLSSSLVEELVLLYKQYVNNQSQHQLSLEEISKLAKAMKLLLLRLTDVELKCKIYSQLNFEDAKEELLQDLAVQAHLKDLKLV